MTPLLSIFIFLLLFVHQGNAYRPYQCRLAHQFGKHIAVANRASGTVSVINPNTLKVVASAKLPNNGEPMYFGFPVIKPELWVGDRRNSRLVILKLKRNKLVYDGYVPTPAGLFHSLNTQNRFSLYPHMWTSCDGGNVTVVHDMTTRKKLAEIPRPSVVAKLGGVPHDATATKDYGFVTYLQNSDGAGYIASFDVRTFKLIKVIKVADDPHIAIRDETKLAISAQGGQVLLVTIPDLRIVNEDLDQPSPHGAVVSFNSRYYYTSNIANEGKNAIVSYDMSTLKRLKCPVINTSNPTPHNLMVNAEGSKIFTTHSGDKSNVVSVLDVGSDGCPKPDTETIIKTGFNPFGIGFIPPSICY